MVKRGDHLGTPKRPQANAVKGLAKCLREDMNKIKRGKRPLKTEQLVAEFHNLYTCYTVLMLMFSTGTRPVWGFSRPQVLETGWTPHSKKRTDAGKTPVPKKGPGLDNDSGPNSLDPVDPSLTKTYLENLKPEFCTWRDKDGPDGYHTRLLWLTKMLRRHLLHYQWYLDDLLKKVKGDESAITMLKQLSRRTFFFLWPTEQGGCLVEEISPKALRNEFKRFGYTAPGNANRSFLKSEWLEQNGPPDVIELFLGHWERGEEGFTASSAFHPADYKKWLEKLLPKILSQLAFEVYEVPKDLCCHWTIAKLPKGKNVSPKGKPVPPKGTFVWDPDDLPGKLWETSRRKLDKSASWGNHAYSPWQKETLCLIKKSLRPLYDAPEKLKISKKALDQLYYKTLTSRVSSSMASRRQKFVYRLLILGKYKNKWSLDLPKAPDASRWGENLLDVDLVESLRIFHSIEGAISKSLEKGLPQSEDEWVGLILLCGILYSGLLRPDCIRRFPAALGSGPRQHETWVWLDIWKKPPPDDPLLRSRAQKDPTCYHRWFADPTTQYLIYQFWDWSARVMAPKPPLEAASIIRFKKTSRTPARVPQSTNPRKRLCFIDGKKALKAYLKTLSETSEIPRPTVKTLMRFSEHRAMTCFPPFLVAYASGKLDARPLHDEALLRALTGRIIPLKRTKTRERRGPFQHRTIFFRMKNQKLQRQNLCSILGQAAAEETAAKKNKKPFSRDKLIEKTQNRIDDFLNDPTKGHLPVIQLLGQWAVDYLLTEKTEIMNNLCLKDPHKFSTVKNYISYIGDHLLDFFRDRDPVEMGEDERQQRYQALLSALDTRVNSSKKPSARLTKYVGRAREALEKFDYYLSITHRFAQSQFSLPEGFETIKQSRRRRSLSLVNANVLTEVDYLRVLDSFRWRSPYLTRLERIQICVTILGRRLGPRRAEILGLRLMDLERVLNMELLIRRHQGRRIKSLAAYRRLPLDLLLNPDEYEFFGQWVLDRVRDLQVRRDDYLFTRTEFDRGMLKDHEVMVPIRDAIRQVTGDETANFHHLRHTFYSDMVVQLLLRRDLQPGTLPFWLTESQSPNPELLRSFRGNLETGRGLLHVLTIPVGHADVPTGMHSYFHHCDWLMAYFARHSLAKPGLSSQAMITLMGVGKSKQKEMGRAKESFPYLSLLNQLADSRKVQLQHPLLKGALDGHSWQHPPLRRQPTFDSSLLALKKNSGSGRSRMRLPRDARELECLETIYNYLARLREIRPKQVQIIRNLASTSLKDGTVRLHTLKDVKECVGFCSKFGISADRLQVSHHSRSSATENRRQFELHHWQNRLTTLAIEPGDPIEMDHKFGHLDVKIKINERIVSPLGWLPALDKMLPSG